MSKEIALEDLLRQCMWGEGCDWPGHVAVLLTSSTFLLPQKPPGTLLCLWSEGRAPEAGLHHLDLRMTQGLTCFNPSLPSSTQTDG